MADFFVYGLVLATVFVFLLLRPVARLTQGPVFWDIGLGTATVIVFVIYFMSVSVSPAMIEEDLAKEPCGSKTPQGVCYNLGRSLCESLWEKAAGDCRQELADVVKARPTGLIGPALLRCGARKMDKGIRFNRANEQTPYCKAYFSYLEEK